MTRKKVQWQIHENGADTNEWVSRSQKKRSSTALQKMGEQLAALSLAQRADFPLSADLEQALTDLAAIPTHEGKRRQMQFVGRLMREIDVEPIQQKLQEILDGQGSDATLLHEAEKLRSAILANPLAVEPLYARWPGEANSLRKLAHDAIEELAAGKPPKMQRNLFRHLRRCLETE